MSDEPGGHHWTAEETDYVRDNARHLRDDAIAARLSQLTGRIFSVGAVREKRLRLGITKRPGPGLTEERLMDVETAVSWLNKYKHRGRTDWEWDDWAEEVNTPQLDELPIHPIDAVCVATLYRGRRVRKLPETGEEPIDNASVSG